MINLKNIHVFLLENIGKSSITSFITIIAYVKYAIAK